MFYNHIKDARIISTNSYFFYRSTIGAVEPVFYFISALFSKSEVSYNVFLLILNLFFSYSLVSLLFRLIKNYIFLVLILFYFATDFYLLVMFSEVHRLKLAFLFLLCCILNLKQDTNVFFKMSLFTLPLFSHLQTVVFYIFLYRKKQTRNVLLVIIGFLLLFFLPFILSKLSYYILSDIWSMFNEFIKTLSISLVFIFLVGNVSSKIDKEYFMFCAILSFLSFIISGDRVNVILIECSVIYFFYCASLRENIKALLLGMVLVSVLSAYNIIRIQEHINVRTEEVRQLQ